MQSRFYLELNTIFTYYAEVKTLYIHKQLSHLAIDEENKLNFLGSVLPHVAVVTS